jgi:hypothetical protein
VIHGIVSTHYVLPDMVSMLYAIAYVEHSEHVIGCNSQCIAIFTVKVSTLATLLEKGEGRSLSKEGIKLAD